MSNAPADRPLRVALLGCGAVAEQFYAPALRVLETENLLAVSALCDPAAERTARLGTFFPAATAHRDTAELFATPDAADLALVLSPVRFHAEQTIAAVRAGAAVLCEKPLAANSTEADAMIAAAREAGKPLAVGLFRRFFPNARTLREAVRAGSLGKVHGFRMVEGARFGWPAASPALFDRRQAGGGVLLDVGAHALDLMRWWFGEPESVQYEDDAMGGVEANARVRVRYADFAGEVRLSRDLDLDSRYVVEFEHGWMRWQAGAANELETGLRGVPYVLAGRLHGTRATPAAPLPEAAGPASDYRQSFLDQIRDLASAARTGSALACPAEEGAAGLRLIERCYRERTLMAQPWMTEREQTRARGLASVAV